MKHVLGRCDRRERSRLPGRDVPRLGRVPSDDDDLAVVVEAVLALVRDVERLEAVVDERLLLLRDVPQTQRSVGAGDDGLGVACDGEGVDAVEVRRPLRDVLVCDEITDVHGRGVRAGRVEVREVVPVGRQARDAAGGGDAQASIRPRRRVHVANDSAVVVIDDEHVRVVSRESEDVSALPEPLPRELRLHLPRRDVEDARVAIGSGVVADDEELVVRRRDHARALGYLEEQLTGEHVVDGDRSDVERVVGPCEGERPVRRERRVRVPGERHVEQDAQLARHRVSRDDLAVFCERQRRSDEARSAAHEVRARSQLRRRVGRSFGLGERSVTEAP